MTTENQEVKEVVEVESEKGRKAAKPKEPKKPAAKKPAAPKKKKEEVKKVRFDRTDLQTALKVSTDFAGRGDCMPILKTVHLSAKGKKCGLFVTDLSVAWETKVPFEGDAVEVCVPLGLIYDEVRALHPDLSVVELTFKGSTVSVNGRCEIITARPEDYPARHAVEGEKFTIQNFGVKLARVAPAISKDETRYNLCCACIDFDGGRLVATDGHRLHMEELGDIGEERVGRMLIPADAVKRIVKFGSGNVITEGEGFRISLDVAGGKMTTRLIEGEYPDYAGVIPADQPLKIEFKASDLLTILEGAVPLSGNAKQIKVTVNGKMQIESGAEGAGTYKYSLPCTATGKEGNFVFGISAAYFKDAVKAFSEDDQVVFGAVDPLSAFLINGKAVIMPARV